MTTAPTTFADEFLDAVVDVARVGISIVNEDGMLVRINPALAEFLGYRQDELTGQHFTIAMPAGIIARAGEFLAAVMSESPRVKDEWRLRRKDGAIIDALVSFKPLTVKTGARFIVVTFTDITARKQAEQQLRESEERFRQLAENIQEVFWIANPGAAGLLYISPAYAAIWGRDPAVLLTDLSPFLDAVHPEDRARVAAARAHQAEGGYQEEYRIVRPDGALRWIRDRAFPVRNDQGEVYRVAGIATDITERRFTVERFRQLNVELEQRIAERTAALSEANTLLSTEKERYRAVVDNAGEGIIVAQDGYLCFANPEALVLTGRTAGELVNTPFLEIIHPADQARVRDNYVQRLRGEPAENHYDFRVAHRDGTLLWLQISAVLIEWEGRPGTLAFLTDVSARKAGETALAQSQERYRAVVDNAEEGIIVAQDGYLRFANPKAFALTGRTSEDLYGTPFLEMIHPGDQARVRDNYVKRLRGEAVENQYDFRVIHGAGEVRWLQISAVMIEWEGRPATLNFLTDVTARKAGEVALAQSEERYRAVVERAEEGIIVAQDGFLRYVNSKALALTGRTLEQAQGTPFLDMVHEDDRARVRDNYLKRLRGEETENQYQIRALHADGSIRWLLVSAVMIQWEGKPAALNLLADVTARRQMEEELRRNLERERELSELRARFIATTSHEFRTPLATILSSAELIEDYGVRLPDSERQEVLGIIKHAVARMNSMIGQVLTIGRGEAGQIQFKPEAADAAALCRTIAAETLGPQQRARLQFQTSGDAVPRLLDERLLRHLVGNLIGNAVKYAPGQAPVTLDLACAGASVTITVTDTGIGIVPEDLPHLFEAFHRGTNTGGFEGAGLGLSIVRQCAELHGGSITVHSALGQGSTFTATLHAPPA